MTAQRNENEPSSQALFRLNTDIHRPVSIAEAKRIAHTCLADVAHLDQEELAQSLRRLSDAIREHAEDLEEEVRNLIDDADDIRTEIIKQERRLAGKGVQNDGAARESALAAIDRLESALSVQKRQIQEARAKLARFKSDKREFALGFVAEEITAGDVGGRS